MKQNLNRLAVVLAGALLLLALPVSAQQKPRWVQKGVKSLNRERSNDSYRFHALSHTETDLVRLETGRLDPLKEFVGQQYGVAPAQLQLDSLTGGGRTTYRLRFAGQGQEHTVLAQLVDECSFLSDEIDNWGVEQHQLYAISERNAAPRFDSFSLTERYPAKAAWMSLIPGLGQIYKGQAGKGYAIMGMEAALLGVVVYSEVEMVRYNRQAKKADPEVVPSYKSNAATFRSVRNGCLIAAGGIYLYNLIDAAVSKGARRVVVKRANGADAEFAFVPVVTADGAGAGMVVRF